MVWSKEGGGDGGNGGEQTRRHGGTEDARRSPMTSLGLGNHLARAAAFSTRTNPAFSTGTLKLIRRPAG